MSAKILAFSGTAKAERAPEKRKELRRPKNSDVRTREYLTPGEVAALEKTARSTGRHGHRDATLILVAYRHGFRVSELVALRWDQIDLKQGALHVNRLKNGSPSVHPLRGPELRALRRLRREYPTSPYVFATERKGPLTPSTVRHVIKRAGQAARLPFQVHPHMLRHACGFKLANDGHDTRAIQQYLGHKNNAHRPVHRTRATTLQRILEGLEISRPRCLDIEELETVGPTTQARASSVVNSLSSL